MLYPYEFSVKTDLPLAKFLLLMGAPSLPEDASIRTQLLHLIYQLSKSEVDSIDCMADENESNTVKVTVYFKSVKKKLYFQSVIEANPE